MKAKLRAFLRKIEPITRTAERVAQLAMQVQTVTPLGAAGLVSAAANAVREHIDQHQGAPPMSPTFGVPVGHDDIQAALSARGVTVDLEERQTGRGDRATALRVFDEHRRATVFPDGDLYVYEGRDFPSRLGAALDAYLPQALHVRRAREVWSSVELALSPYTSTQGQAIVSRTLPMLGGADGRTLLLYGRPGVGKTTMAQEIARAVGGRVALLGCGVFRPRGDEGTAGAMTTSADPSFNFLRASVLIVDDIDKVELSLSVMEHLRAAARLVIFTANNGEHDDVLDAAMTRPGRMDETEEVVPDQERPPAPPFDQLSPDLWTQVRGWPVAHLIELGRRIEQRGTAPDDLRIEDLQRRIDRKTRSGDVLR